MEIVASVPAPTEIVVSVPAPPAKRLRRGPTAYLREQGLQRQQSVGPASVQTCEAVVPVPEQVAADFSQPIAETIDADDIITGNGQRQDIITGADRIFSGGATWAKRQYSAVDPSEAKPPEEGPQLTSSEDLGNDMSIKTALRLTNAHASLRWLRRLPPALRCQTLRSLDSTQGSAAREAVLDFCKEYIPKLMESPDKAIRLMERIASSLSWYQVDGLPSLNAPTVHLSTLTAEERAIRRRIDEWDEAFRSLEVLLRQGVVSTFSVTADRFTVVVFGEGAGPWQSSRTGLSHQPARGAPCAVMFPSQDEVRTMLQENHVPFDVAPLPSVDESAQGRDLRARTSEEEGSSYHALAIAAGIVPRELDSEVIRSELRDLRRDGQKVVTPEDKTAVISSSALWFEGGWRVHALLDILRQHFLRSPLLKGVVAPPRLPSLAAPEPFAHSAVRSARVLRTQSLQAQGSAPQHSAELEGVFFPGQVKRFLEYLRVLLPSFGCKLTADAGRAVGINTFTLLGSRHIESVECERTPAEWKWDFKLAA